jgi:hypothetical protein
MAQGTGGYGLLTLVVASERHFKGSGVPKNFARAREIFSKTIHRLAHNMDNGIPDLPHDEWWFYKKWTNANSAIIIYAPRYGFKIIQENNKPRVVEIDLPELSDKDLYSLR